MQGADGEELFGVEDGGDAVGEADFFGNGSDAVNEIKCYRFPLSS